MTSSQSTIPNRMPLGVPRLPTRGAAAHVTAPTDTTAQVR